MLRHADLFTTARTAQAFQSAAARRDTALAVARIAFAGGFTLPGLLDDAEAPDWRDYVQVHPVDEDLLRALAKPPGLGEGLEPPHWRDFVEGLPDRVEGYAAPHATGGVTPAPDWLKDLYVIEMRAPQGGLTADSAAEILEEMHRRMKTMEPLEGRMTEEGDGLGTTAIFQSGDHVYLGVNGKAVPQSKANKDAQRARRDELELNNGDAQFLFHAEAHALIRGHLLSRMHGRELENEVVMYTDRKLCGWCRKNLPALLYVLGMNKIHIHARGHEPETLTAQHPSEVFEK